MAIVELAPQCLEGLNSSSRQGIDDVMSAGSTTGRYVTARNNMADRNPLRAAPVSIGSHPYSEKKGAPLRCICRQNIWQTRALHVEVGVRVVKVED